ncbi:hypothetical protein SAMN05216490_0095 [Mucilaginibacter mallensis]|uniref:Uncharacterized protein n=1 Tax=Mucilaginibacter mallensis TaxID=652787 RepID=A0A1H1MJV2_MUCMA|nr:hypothetical protein SAMN05216490_0095 [Mucilaginibacter mallensis]
MFNQVIFFSRGTIGVGKIKKEVMLRHLKHAGKGLYAYPSSASMTPRSIFVENIFFRTLFLRKQKKPLQNLERLLKFQNVIPTYSITLTFSILVLPCL